MVHVRLRHFVVLCMFSVTPIVLWHLLDTQELCAGKEALMFLQLRTKGLNNKVEQIAARMEQVKPKVAKVENYAKQIMSDNIKDMKRTMDASLRNRQMQHVNDDGRQTNSGQKGQNTNTQVLAPNALPDWIERFKAPHWSEFKPWKGVFVFLISYRPNYLKKCLDSIVKANNDIDKNSVCVFALDRPLTKRQETGVNKTMELLRNVTFCRRFVWQVNSDKGRPPEKNRALRLKYHWWFVLESIFNATMTGNQFNGTLKDYTDDVLFVEEDAVLAPDFVKVQWFLSGVKRLNNHIIQTALGGWSGENMINAHPDTVIVRTARTLRGIAYGLNQSTWHYFKSLEREFLEDTQHDWCESMGLVLGIQNKAQPFHIVVPTLSRIWHIGRWGLGLGGDFEWERPVTEQPNWAFASRLLDLKQARVSPGLRDILGFLCARREFFWFLENTTCPKAMSRWKGKDRNRIMCLRQPYVDDPCDVYV